MKTNLITIIMLAIFAATFSGCAILGADVQGLSEVKEAHVKVFDKSASECYALTANALSKWKAIIYQGRKDDYIVAMELEKVYRSCINTTELGIFFTEIEPNKTEVRVTSGNYELSRFIAKNLFNYIEKDGKVPAEEELVPVTKVSTGNPFKN